MEISSIHRQAELTARVCTLSTHMGIHILFYNLRVFVYVWNYKFIKFVANYESIPFPSH